MDMTIRMVEETEGYHGCALRGWHGEEERQMAEVIEYDRYQEEQERMVSMVRMETSKDLSKQVGLVEDD